MGTTYLPSTAADLSTWAANFVDKLEAEPGAFGVSADAVAALRALQLQYQSLFVATSDPGTRTSVAIAARRDAAESLKASARQAVGIVRSNTDDAQKLSLGLTVSGARQTAGTPTLRPVLHVAYEQGGALVARLTQPGVGSRRVPAGVAGAILFTQLADEPSEDFRDWRFETLTGQTKVRLAFPPTLPMGTPVWVTAAYFSTRKALGAMATPVRIHLVGEFRPAPARLAA